MRATLALALSIGALPAACSDEEPTPCFGDLCDVSDAGNADADADDAPDAPEGSCEQVSAWTAGTPVFREVTAEWGLKGVVGTRISLGDVDGDGRVDAFVRRGGVRSNEYDADGARHAWLLRNTGSGFEDITWTSGVDESRTPVGGRGRPYEIVAFADVDNDGDLDIYTGSTTVDATATRGERSEILINRGEDGFFLGPEDSELRRALDVVAGASFTDVDRDGNIDLWVPQHNYEPPGGGIAFSQDLLYRGDGAGAFTEITHDAGLTTVDWQSIDDLNAGNAHSRAWSATACDLNNDGAPELLAASYGRAPNHLWQGARGDDGSVAYTNRSVASGYAYDDDLSWHDNQFARCFCASNPDAEDCEGVPAPSIQCQANWQHGQDRQPFRLGGNSGATVCADLDNDGWMDLVTTEIKHWWAGSGADGSDILFNQGRADVTFDRPGRDETGFDVPHPSAPSWDEGHMSATVLDFDNDGWTDIYIGASDYPGNFGLLYRQDSPRHWTRVDVADAFEHNRSHGVAAADFDNDGDIDLMVGHSRSRCDANAPNNCYDTQQVRLFENVLGGNWVQLDLEGAAGTNRAAIGAVVRVEADGVTQTQEVGGGYGHYGAQNDRVLHFGLGDACEATVTVRWPDAARSEQTFVVESGLRYHVPQGDAPSPEAR